MSHKDLFLAHYYFSFIIKHIGCSIRLFPDDASGYIVVDVPLQSTQLLNTDLQTISDWVAVWLVTFNPLEILPMIISRKRNPVFHPALFTNGTIIKNTTSHNHLCLTFFLILIVGMNMSNLSQKKPWSRLTLLITLKFRISRFSFLEKLYFAYIRIAMLIGAVVLYNKKIY